MDNWDGREMLDWYLYDYFRKNNMHETAENFLREVNFPLDPTTVSPAVDVPEGFLQEWWGFFSDMYFGWQLRAPDQGEGPSSTMPIEQMMGAGQQVDPSLSTQYVMNDQTISHLLAGTGLSRGNNAMGSMHPVTGVEIIPEAISSTLHQQDLLGATLAPLPGYCANLTAEELGYLVLPSTRKDDIASNEETGVIPQEFADYVLNPISVTENQQKELWDKLQSPQSGGESMNKLDSEDGTRSLQGDASLKTYKSCDDNAQSSSSNANGNKEDADSSFSELPDCATTPDNLIVHQVVKFNKAG